MGVGVGVAALAVLDDEVVVLLVVVPDDVVLFVELVPLEDVVLLDELVLGVVDVEPLRVLEPTFGKPDADVEVDGLGVTLGTVAVELPEETEPPMPVLGELVVRGDGVDLEEPPLLPVT